MEKTNEWIEIKRDKQGFATEECLNEMFDNALIIVTRNEFYRVYYDVIKRENKKDWKNKIIKDLRYTHYLPVPNNIN